MLQPPKPGLDTGFVVSMVDAAGERTFVTSPGAEATLTAADLAQVAAGPADAVYLSGYSLVHPGEPGRPARLAVPAGRRPRGILRPRPAAGGPSRLMGWLPCWSGLTG